MPGVGWSGRPEIDRSGAARRCGRLTYQSARNDRVNEPEVAYYYPQPFWQMSEADELIT